MRGTFVFLLILTSAFAEDSAAPALTARQLYYKTRPKAAAVKAKPVSSTGMPVTTPVETKPASTEAQYLGLRYSIVDGNSRQEIDPSKAFHSGDAIRLKLQSNSNGYLYILTQGSSGAWKFLFPSAELRDNTNEITRDQVTEIPSSQAFEFDTAPGAEKLFVVLSRDREPDLESLLGSVKSGQAGAGNPSDQGRVMQAQNRAPADIEQLRAKFVARDLRVQSIRAATDKKGENAVYVAASQPATARVVTEITLRHE